MKSRQMGRTIDTFMFDEAQVKLPLWKKFYLWTWGRRYWKHISIWVLKDEKKERRKNE